LNRDYNLKFEITGDHMGFRYATQSVFTVKPCCSIQHLAYSENKLHAIWI